MFPGRFWLGLGAGEALNEHVVGGILAGGAASRLRCCSRRSRSSRSCSAARSSSTRASTSRWRAPGSTRCRKSRRRSTSPPPARSMRKRTGRLLRRHHHGRRGRREDQDAVGRVREGRARGRQGPRRTCRSCSRSTSPGPTTREAAVEKAVREWPNGGHAVPEAGHPPPGGLRGDGQAGAAGELQEPGADLARPRRARAPTSRSSSISASTRSTSTTSGATRARSSTRTARRSCRSSAWARG